MRITIINRGTVAHSSQVGTSALGQSSKPIGQVEVRLGDVVEMPNGSRITNLIALEYTGGLASQSNWLQFVWFEMTALTTGGAIQLSGTVPTSSGLLPFTTDPSMPNWAVDSGPIEPFYESGGLSIRFSRLTTIFDRPGGSSVAPLAKALFRAGLGATGATFTAHFETYLIQNNIAVYQVVWSASTPFTMSKADPIRYNVSRVGDVTGLRASLRGILHLNYHAYRNVR